MYSFGDVAECCVDGGSVPGVWRWCYHDTEHNNETEHTHAHTCTHARHHLLTVEDIFDVPDFFAPIIDGSKHRVVLVEIFVLRVKFCKFFIFRLECGVLQGFLSLLFGSVVVVCVRGCSNQIKSNQIK